MRFDSTSQPFFHDITPIPSIMAFLEPRILAHTATLTALVNVPGVSRSTADEPACHSVVRVHAEESDREVEAHDSPVADCGNGTCRQAVGQELAGLHQIQRDHFGRK